MRAMVLGLALGATAPGPVAAGARPRLRASSTGTVGPFADAKVRGSSFSARDAVQVAVYSDATGEIVDLVDVRTTRNGTVAVWVSQPCSTGVIISATDLETGISAYRHLRVPGCLAA